jgi:hypothetical protein
MSSAPNCFFGSKSARCHFRVVVQATIAHRSEAAVAVAVAIVELPFFLFAKYIIIISKSQ